MRLQAHFHHIKKVVTQNLQSAQSEILAVVAWFTDREIFDALCKQAQAGVQVAVAVLSDDVSRGPGTLNYQRLCNLGGKVVFLPPPSDCEPMMHSKFCVLDGITVITGSFNWSGENQRNDENITVATEAPEFAAKYRLAFQDLLARSGQVGVAAQPQADAESVRRRLELLRNLILLGEQDDLPPHLSKLRPAADALRLQPILRALESGAYKAALESIEEYLRSSSTIILREDADISRLQLQLQAMELRLESLIDEKADLERGLVIFNRRYSDALGALLIKVLAAQAEMARHKAEASRKRAAENQFKAQEAQQDTQHAQQAEQDWQEYRREYDEEQAKVAPNTLSAQEEAELKKLYRIACSLCHPDKFAEDQKSAAHVAFVALQEIYTVNDLKSMRELYANLKSGVLSSAPRSSTLSRADALRAAIAELQHRITETLHQLQALYNSEGAVLLRNAGETEADWSLYFEKQKKLLLAELDRLRKEIVFFVTANTHLAGARD